MKRDAKVSYIRSEIANEIELIRLGANRIGRPAPSVENRGVYIGGLRRALEILDKIDDETR